MQTLDLSKLPLNSTNELSCKLELADARWEDKFVCPACGGAKYYFLKKRVLYECANRACRKQTSATAGTRLHGSRKIPELFTALKAQRGGSELTSKTIRQLTGMSHRSAKRMQNKILGKDTQPMNLQKLGEKQKYLSTLSSRRSKTLGVLKQKSISTQTKTSHSEIQHCPNCSCLKQFKIANNDSVQISMHSLRPNPLIHIALPV